MSDSNIPRYGEKATPEQQAAARGAGVPESTPEVPTPAVPSYQAPAQPSQQPPAFQAPAYPAQQPPAYQAPAYGAPAPGAPGAAPAGYAPWQGAPQGKGGLRAGDATATIILLALGVLGTLFSLTVLLPMPQILEQVFAQQGFGDYTSQGVAQTMALVGVLGQIALLAVAAWASIAGIIKRRLSWWIPLVAGVIAVILVVAVMCIAIMSDPAFTVALESGRI